jgi:hypothetical protein
VGIERLRRHFNYLFNPHLRTAYKLEVARLARIHSLKQTLRFVDTYDRSGVEVWITSEAKVVSSEMTDGVATTTQINENLTDILGDDQDFVSAGNTYYSDQGQKNLLSVDNFFKRPMQITNGVLTNSAFVQINLPVWDLYTLNPAVRAKLRNYTYLRADLHVRIVVSGTPYHYGKLMVSYQPYAQRNANLIDLDALFAINTDVRQMYINYLSQSEGATTMDIRENKPLEIVCPFISTKNAHRLYNADSAVLGDTTSYEDLSEAGDLYIWSINAANVINVDTDPARYYVYAWMENVDLGPPTGTHVEIRTEARDERETGPIEKVASSARVVSDALQKIPSIQPMAMASSMAFGAIESIASLFGWSRPLLLDTPCYVKNVAFQNGAHTIGTETNYKITLDPKQELTVDPSVTGGSEDEMSFAHILSRPCYLTTFGWIPDDVPLTPLFRCAITPTLNSTAIVEGYKVMQQTPMSFVAAPFISWRGEIEFTLEIVCSQFHRGKLAVIYEPNIEQHVLIDASLDLNKQYLNIIDIQETQTVTFKFGWAAARSWLRCSNRIATNTQQYSSTASVLNLGSVLVNNGYFIVVPITDLISPDNNTIEVNVYVKCPDLKVNGLSQAALPESRSTGAPALVEIVSEANDQLATQDVTFQTVNDSLSSPETIAIEHYGEVPVSFRALLKRYVGSTDRYVSLPTTAATAYVVWDVGIYPFQTLPYGVDAPYFTKDLFSYLRYAYLGVRGGYRHRVRTQFAGGLRAYSYFKATLLPEDTSEAVTDPEYIVTGGGTNISRATSQLSGTVSMDRSSNGGMEFEFPFYSRNKFHFAFADDYIGSNPGGAYNMTDRWFRNVSYSFFPSTITAATSLRCTIDVASAEDFTFLRFQGAPHFTSTITS